MSTAIKFNTYGAGYSVGDMGYIESYAFDEEKGHIAIIVNLSKETVVVAPLSNFVIVAYASVAEIVMQREQAVTGAQIQKKDSPLFKKAVYIDVETTGTDPVKHGIHQLSGIIEVDGGEVENFDFRPRPRDNEEISEEALKVAGVTKDQIMAGTPPGEVLIKFKNMLKKYVDPYDKTDKFQFVGYNASFDMKFIREFFKKGEDSYFGSWFYFPYIDVMSKAAYELRNERNNLPNFKLTTVAKYLGIEFDEEKAHNALFDIELTKEVLKRLENK